jgi:tetratricopeptide (TPR) repeat protein
MMDHSQNRATAIVQQAMSALDANRPVEAERIARQALKDGPRHAEALRILGYALLMQNRAHDAVVALEPAVRGSHDPELETQFAIALRQAGQTEEAMHRLKRAIKRKPPYAAAFHELGCLLASMKRYDEAIATFKRGLEIAPMTPELSIQLGYACLNNASFIDAKAAFDRALTISPASHEARFGMAMACQELGEFEQAAEELRHCLRAKPDDPAALLGLGNCLLALGQHEAGYEYFRAVVRGADPKRYGMALGSLVKAAQGRFWLRPSDAAQFLRDGAASVSAP